MPVVHVAHTPNPNARKFVVASRLVGTGTYEYASADETTEAPLAAKLFEVDGVINVLIASDFVTVRKTDDHSWSDIESSLTQRIIAFLDSYGIAVLVERGPEGRRPANEVEERIVALLDDEIRPAVATDGGDVTFMGFSDGTVLLRMSGACGTCPSAVTTLKMGIERLLVEEVPEVRAVEQVA